MPPAIHTPLPQRLFAAAGALVLALAVGLGAYAAHAVSDPAAKGRLDTAVLYLVIHGLALCIFAPRQSGLMARFVLGGWLLGTLLFCGSLIAGALWGTPTTLAPFGGMLLIASWLLRAVASLRR